MEGIVALDSSGAAPETLGSSEKDRKIVVVGRAEIDTSAPFESVKEAVDRFGGSAVWKSQLKQLFHPPEKHHWLEDVDIMKVEEQAAQLEKDLILKERETLDVLKELERTKKIVDDLKLRIQKESSEFAELPTVNSGQIKALPILKAEEHCPGYIEKHVDMESPSKGANQPPGLMLNELKQAKVNLSRTTIDLSDIQNFIELFSCKIEKEKQVLEQTREKLISNTALASSLEEDLNQTSSKLQMAKDLEYKRCKDPSSILEEIKETKTLIEQSRKIAESAKDEINKLTSDIEQTKASIKTAEIQLVAAKRVEEATKASEARALAEIKAITSSNNSAMNSESSSGVTLSMEEYALLTLKAQEADEMSRKKIEVAKLQVDEANRSKSELLAKVEEATKEVKVFARALEDALKWAEVANQGKLAVEDALRKWRAEHGHKSPNIQNSTKFKNHAAHHRRDSHVLDSTLVADVPSNGFRPPLSIGQILSMKLMGPVSEEYEVRICEKENEKLLKVSLGQMLNKKQRVSSPKSQKTEDGSAQKKYSGKRKKLGFVGFPLLLAKQNKQNKKRESLITR